MAKLFSAERRAERAKFYQHKLWRRIRAKQLALKPLCEACEAAGRLEAAVVCDHKDAAWQGWQGWPFSEPLPPMP